MMKYKLCIVLVFFLLYSLSIYGEQKYKEGEYIVLKNQESQSWGGFPTVILENTETRERIGLHRYLYKAIEGDIIYAKMKYSRFYGDWVIVEYEVRLYDLEEEYDI